MGVRLLNSITILIWRFLWRFLIKITLGNDAAKAKQPANFVAEWFAIITFIRLKNAVFWRPYFFEHRQDLFQFIRVSAGHAYSERISPLIHQQMGGISLALVAVGAAAPVAFARGKKTRQPPIFASRFG